MNTFSSKDLCPKIKIIISATLLMIRESLKMTVKSSKQISVLDTVEITQELIVRISRQKPDVLLLCLAEDEGERIEILRQVLQAAPLIKIVVLTSPNTALDHTSALKLGVSGIVNASQSARTLIRAIQQVAEGEVWLNQKLISQIISGGMSDQEFAKSNVYNGKHYFPDELTTRELEVVKMIGGGACNKAISKKLFISEATVRHHLSSIYSKLCIEDRLNLAIYAYSHKIVLPPSTDAAVNNRYAAPNSVSPVRNMSMSL